MGALFDLLKEIPLTAVLKEKIANFEAEKASLKQENASLKDDLRKAKTEIVNLKNEIQNFTHTDGFHETEIEILVYLADEEALHFRDSMAINLQLNHARLDYFLEKLKNREYISWVGGSSVGEAIRYFLTPKGRDYLFNNNLI
jgi:DNA-binding MarR family transcriptional regulator